MKRLILLLVVAFAMVVNTDAQGWLNRLKDKAKSKIENKIDDAVDKAMDKGIDKAEDEASDAVRGKKGKTSKDDESGEDNPSAATSSDFKRGEMILFQDDFQGETIGEFPSKWDMFQGTIETKTLGGVKAINMTDNAQVQPLIKEQGAYLPEEFTIEYDFYYWNQKDDVALNDVKLILAITKDRSELKP